MAIAVAQQVTNPAAGGGLTNATSTTQTAAITPSAGSTLIVLARGQGGANTPTCADNVNAGSHTQLLNVNDGNANWTAFIKQNVAASATTVTATWPTTNANRGLIVLEITGGNTTGGADAAANSTGNTSGNMVTASAAALVIGFGLSEAGSTWAAGGGFTAGTAAWGASGDMVLPESLRVTSAGTYAATFTGGVGSENVFGIILGEATASAAGVPSRRQQAQLVEDDPPPARQRRSALIQQAPVISVVPPFRRQRALAQDDDAPPQAPRRFVPQVAAVVASFVPFRRQPPQVDPDPTFVWMGSRSAQIQMPSGDPPPVGWPRRLLSLLSWTEPDPPPPARRFAPIPTVVVPPDNPPIGWPRRLLALLQPQDPDALATRRLLAPPQSPPPAPPPVRSRRLFDTYRDAWDEPPLPIVRRPTVVTSGPVPPTPPPAPGSIYDWNADDAAIIGQMFRGGGFPFQIPKVG